MQQVIIYLGLPKTKSTFLAESYKKKIIKLFLVLLGILTKKHFKKSKNQKVIFL